MCAEVSPKQSAAINLDQIIRAEAGVINDRRRNEPRDELKRPPLDVTATGPGAPVLDVVGLTLSGGGIRSASFSLGVLQALDQHDVLPRLDYLSTVSGGGYIGTSLSATMNKTGGSFVFGHSTGMRADARPADVKDSESVGHLRNYSNYLIPFGARDLITAGAIVLRGLIANASLVLPVVLLLAAVTILANPTRGDLTGPDFFGFGLTWLPVMNFGITLLLALLAFPLFLAWAIYRSRLSEAKQSEFRTWLPTLGATYLILIAFSFFCELQPYVIAGMFDLSDKARTSSDGDLSLLTAFVQRLAAIATPIAASSPSSDSRSARCSNRSPDHRT
jgi:hypothetical protein